MSITIKKTFIKSLTFEKLYNAHIRAKSGKSTKSEIILFEKNLENNLINLLNKLKNNTYTVGKYRKFIIYEPKEREIKSLPYTDRVVHQWYIEEFIKPYIIPRLINNTFACIDNRGTHKSVIQVQKYMQQYSRNISNNYYILKCDIKKFFYSINPNILFSILKKYITDKKLLSLTKILIFENIQDNKGIPIGNYTSQFFANIYLNELDQYVFHTLKHSTYVRYMDDFIILIKNKEDAINLKLQIETFLKEKLNLELNHKSRYYPSKMGVNFCGYRIYSTHKLLRQNSKKKINKKINKYNNDFNNNNLNITNAITSLNAWYGHIKHCNSYNIKNKIINKCNFFYTDKIIEKHEQEILNLMFKKGSE